MTKDNPCKHDLLGVLHCKKCGEQYHVDWLDALKQTKLEAVGEVLTRITTTINTKSNKGAARDAAIDLLEKSIKEVQDVYDNIITSQTFLKESKIN